nr:C-GCAxxG-C-C family protein [Clostridia bacterium]
MDISRTEQAVWYKHNGYNCCMSVLMAYKDELGIDETMVRRLCVAFGSGMGG